MAVQSYLVDDPGSFDALLTTCHTCMPNKSSTCPDCTTTATKTLVGEDPDSGTAITWSSEEVQGNNGINTRSTKVHRFPYQIISQYQDLGCNSNCVYLVRIQYKLQTSSARRSFFQTGFSDIWLVERWSNAGDIQELHYVANSVPFDYDNAELRGAYGAGAITAAKKAGSAAVERTHFNPYGLRENYDPLKDVFETHCGTLMFFARGNDRIKFRLAQHTRLHTSVDINPERFSVQSTALIQSPWRDYSGGRYNATGVFNLKVYTRPIAGRLKLSDKAYSVSNPITEYQLKYHPKLY